MVAALAEKHRFLHWRQAFPDVFTSPHTPTAEGNLEGAGGRVKRSGFDVILGNPPWERIKVQEKEFFADKAPDIANARTAAQRRKLIKRLPESDPALHAAYIDALYAHLYHLTREELAYILDTFPIVKRKDEAQYGEYRTKRLVMERYEEITTIRGSGDPL